jgi:hypothetical protein
VIRERCIDASGERALAVVQHLGSLPVWERKARHVTVTTSGPAHGTYKARGRIVGVIRWRAIFDYELTDTGFHSWMRAIGRRLAGGGVGGISTGPGLSAEVQLDTDWTPT